MKVFDYKCWRCGHEKEAFVKKWQAVICPECNNNMRKMPSAPGMVKGNCADKVRVGR